MVFRLNFKEKNSIIKVGFDHFQTVTESGGGSEVYQGDYAVVPKAIEQSLLTKEKYLTDDITVKAIPFFNVSNNAGGKTIYIGSEVENNG